MNVSQQTFQLMVLGLPGIICLYTYRNLVGERETSKLDTVLSIFLYSVLSYALYGFICYLILKIFYGVSIDFKFIFFFTSKDYLPTSREMLLASVMGVILSFILSAGNRFQLLNRIAGIIGASTHFMSDDVIDYLLASPGSFLPNYSNRNKDWVIVRDYSKGLDYVGDLVVWKNSNSKIELLLYDVSVFSDGNELYNLDKIYLSRKENDISIEKNPRDISFEDTDEDGVVDTAKLTSEEDISSGAEKKGE